MPYKTLIIDDEALARKRMRRLLAEHQSFFKLIGEAVSGFSAVKMIENLKPDLIFLDIQMPDFDGFEVLNKISQQPLVIFATAHHEYAVKAFEQFSVDYLVKPVEPERLKKSTEKLKKMGSVNANLDIEQLQLLMNDLKPKREPVALPVKTGDKIVLVRYSDIVFFQAKDKYVNIITSADKNYLTDLSLSALEVKLPDYFLRVQKSYIVNSQKILEIHKFFNNRLILVTDDKHQSRIMTGTTYISQIRRALGLK